MITQSFAALGESARFWPANYRKPASRASLSTQIRNVCEKLKSVVNSWFSVTPPKRTPLASAGIRSASALATVLPNDAANVFITLTARELNESLTILARAENPSTEKKLIRSGASKVVLPAAIGASRIARLITRPTAEEMLSGIGPLNEDLEHLGLRVTEFAISETSDLAGGTLEDVDFGASIPFAHRAVDGTLTQHPASSTVLANGDLLFLMRRSDQAIRLKRRFLPAGAMTYRGVQVPRS